MPGDSSHTVTAADLSTDLIYAVVVYGVEIDGIDPDAIRPPT